MGVFQTFYILKQKYFLGGFNQLSAEQNDSKIQKFAIINNFGRIWNLF